MVKPELESKLEERCVAKIEARGGLALKLRPPTGKGYPDRTVFLPGCRVWCPEVKRLKLGQISAQQYEWQRVLAAVDINVYFIDTDEQFDEALLKEMTR